MNRWIGKSLIVAAFICLLNAAWIPAKAALAQHLLQQAWQRTLAGERQVKAWPWADTWPVARLRAPDHGVDLIVLAGGSGRTLAFGPGHMDGTERPGGAGNSVIGGHRDTHFAFLGDLTVTDRLLLETTTDSFWLQVTDIQVVNSAEAELNLWTEDRLLTLVTCYPLDAQVPGGPLRLVVTAEPVPALAIL
ncbi:MAG: class GN sortase [Proteobacteria bacterium]|nr:class GN sortase [Pseudomonadota bacterium]